VRQTRLTGALALGLLAVACATRRPPAPAPVVTAPADLSGFLDDYSRLRPGGPGEVRFVYRDPAARWDAYDKVLFEPVTLWRSGRKSLDPVPERDLLRLAGDLQRAVRRRLGKGWTLVNAPGPGVMRVRLAITQARATDAVLDVLTTETPSLHGAKTNGPVDAETRAFIEAASIEGEITDAQTGQILAQGIDRRIDRGPLSADLTWTDVDRFFDFWAERICSRLERARRGELP
jgi:Protein of unknown function (DUF3313)